MSLSELLINSNPNNRSKKSIGSPLASLCSKLEYSNDEDLFNFIYDDFPAYSLELTISPKSSSVLLQTECATCGRASLRDLDQQSDIMYTLLNELLGKFKINILGVTELYGDQKNIHTHNIITPTPISIRSKIIKYIKAYYDLDNKYVVNIQPINSTEKFKQYMQKGFYKDETFNFHYYDRNKNYSLEKVKKEEHKEQQLIQYKLKQEQIYNDPILFHLHDCDFENCPICKWINDSENVSQSNQTVIR